MTRQDEELDEPTSWKPTQENLLHADERCHTVFKWGRVVLWWTMPIWMTIWGWWNNESVDFFSAIETMPPLAQCPDVTCPACPAQTLICPPWPDGTVQLPEIP